MSKPVKSSSTLKKDVASMERTATALKDSGVIEMTPVRELAAWRLQMRIKHAQTIRNIQKINRRPR